MAGVGFTESKDIVSYIFSHKKNRRKAPVKNFVMHPLHTSHQRRAVDGDFVAELADFGVADDGDGLVLAQFGFAEDPRI